ncbi:tyrosine-type recombinase/integrase [Clostridium butyricum]|uniref:tyrosine-type recombinase/integrase n=1 Tax=Clostridium butyricum TaxID=1492 RepID=UPI001CA87877|nr:site-specific integrase [Clostridium butyricum]MBZ0313337.1 site-specific integrase [Clostridium butyricum]
MAVKTNFESNGQRYYRITYDVGIDANGKRIRKQFVGKSKKEAEMKKQEYINKMNSRVQNKTYWFAQEMKTWLFEVIKMSGNIKLSSFSRYAGIYEKYFENCPFSHMSLDKIESIDIQRYYNSLHKDGKSSNIIKNNNKLLKQFFNYAVDCGYILRNPCSGKKVVIPKDSLKDIDDTVKSVPVFCKEDMNKILSNKEDTKIRYLSLISYATGMRRGEILGLHESDIDYENNEIHIRRTLVSTYVYDDHGKKHKETFLDNTKTHTSVRDIPLPTSLIPIIKSAISLKKQDILKCGSSFNKDHKDMIFLTENSEFIDAGNIDKSWIYFLKRCKVNHLKFHALRHTYATLQFENNIRIETVSKLLGHSTIEMTANTYTHVLKKEKQKSIDTLSLLG